MINSFKDLILWQKAVHLTLLIYRLTETFPESERFGLVSQMRRSSVSIPSNVAEGRNRGTRKDFVQFLRISSGSTAELETQLEISKKLKFGKEINYNDIDSVLIEIKKMLSSMISKLKADSSKL